VWLVDLQTDADPPPLRVTVNGEQLPTGDPGWRRLFGGPPDPDPAGRGWRLGYETYAEFAGRPLSSWPQWWAVPAEPRRGAGGGGVAFGLPAPEGAPRARLGIALGDGRGGRFYGPAAQTSVYRWIAVGDWRLWGRTVTAAAATRGHFTEGGADGSSPFAG